MIPLADLHENWMTIKCWKNQSSSISERKRARSYHYVFRPVGHQELFQMQNSKGKPGGNAKSASETNILNHLICCYYLYTAIFNRFITSVLADFITSVFARNGPKHVRHQQWYPYFWYIFRGVPTNSRRLGRSLLCATCLLTAPFPSHDGKLDLNPQHYKQKNALQSSF